ncbi:helix-turn-helix domain of resolvase [Methanobrevibacter cuticularis]|uniref:Helix-turn-helix domain of resolvase n=1 Tax=Methanobrevibacter cuticularis TaxID=47311 RepID=A0A166CT53_9EURY|nr:hypothetical protein [Methanobrevibacter cuticularis]KZX14835.1 helix-turn-helix domain of resolvase [Methanobrevibacter cuticularis]
MSTNEKDSKRVHINSPLTSKKIIELIDNYPNLQIITCPPSLYNRISKKYLDALEELGISTEIEYNWGSEKKYNDECREEVISSIKNGLSPLEIAKKLDISIKTVYYLKDKNLNEKITLKRGKKRKYSEESRKKVKKLSKEGMSAKVISKQENIPLRTVYYILKND